MVLSLCFFRLDTSKKNSYILCETNELMGQNTNMKKDKLRRQNEFPKSSSRKGNAGLYVRVSTFNQIDRDSLKTQEERLKAYCTASGVNKYEIYKDPGYSAKDTNRPALESLMRDIRANKISSVFVTKLDRITRSLSDLMQLIDFFKIQNVQFVSITESIDTSTAMGRFMQHLLGLIAQLEREITAERVTIDMLHRAKQGKWNGGVIPYGYTTQALLMKKHEDGGTKTNVALSKVSKICPEPKKLYVDPEESAVVKLIHDNFLKTNSIRKTTNLLNTRGIKTRREKLWAKSTIHRILSAPVYSGKICYGKRKSDQGSGKLVNQKKETWIIVEGEHDAIISEEVFNEVQKLLGLNKGKPTKQGRTYILSGLLRCGFCGGAMAGQTFTKKGNGKKYSYYKCVNKLHKGDVACKGLTIPAKSLETFIVKELKKLSSNKLLLSDKKKMIEIIKAKTKQSEINIDIKRVEKEKKTLEKRLSNLLDKLERGLISDDDFQPRYNRIKADLSVLDEEKLRLSDLDGSKRIVLQSLEATFEEISSFQKNWKFLDDIGKAMRIKAIVKEIRATKDKIDMDIYMDVANVSHMDRD